jgi:mono/diheme cytochrome c family protein
VVEFRWIAALLCVAAMGFAAAAVRGEEPAAPVEEESAAQRGYRLLLNKPYLEPDFDQATFDNLWRVWDEPLKSAAAKASPEERRAMAFARYGLVGRPDDPTKPLQYVIDDQGNYTMNCLACHQGQVAGVMIPGAPNSTYALETLTADLRLVKVLMGKPWARMERGSLAMPLGTTVGTTNAVMFGVALMHLRDAELNVHLERLAPPMVHHDHDMPAWWHYRRKSRLYADGFVPKDHRALMPFLMIPANGPEKFREWEDDFRAIEAYISSLAPPKYPGPIDRELSRQGELVFNENCARCHGTYGEDGRYPEKIVALDEVGTDPVRLTALSREHRQNYRDSWFGYFGQHAVELAPEGYLAPPLYGVWASGPYFHNGSVPTLWHVLHPDERPVVWRRADDGYDHARVGLEVDELAELPGDIGSAARRRTYFDTRVEGKSAAGHDFPSLLSAPQRRAVLEYLKTL